MSEQSAPVSAPEGNDVIMALVAEVGGESGLREILAERQRARSEALNALSARFSGVDFSAMPTAALKELLVQSAVKPVEPAGLGPNVAPEVTTYLPLEAIQ